MRPLVAFGHAIDGVDADGNTAMHTAASCGQAAVLRMLIMCNADPNVANRRGQDALLCAVRSKSNTMVRACCTVAVPLRCCALCGPRATPWYALAAVLHRQRLARGKYWQIPSAVTFSGAAHGPISGHCLGENGLTNFTGAAVYHALEAQHHGAHRLPQPFCASALKEQHHGAHSPISGQCLGVVDQTLPALRCAARSKSNTMVVVVVPRSPATSGRRSPQLLCAVRSNSSAGWLACRALCAR